LGSDNNEQHLLVIGSSFRRGFHPFLPMINVAPTDAFA